MARVEDIETQIRGVLATETTAFAVSRQLFHPTGLFAGLAATEAERRVVAKSALFQEAQRRLSDLQRHKATAFSQAVARAQSPILDDSLLVQRFDPVGV